MFVVNRAPKWNYVSLGLSDHISWIEGTDILGRLLPIGYFVNYNKLKSRVTRFCLVPAGGKHFEHFNYFETLKVLKCLHTFAQNAILLNWCISVVPQTVNMTRYPWFSNEPRYHMLQLKPALKENTSCSGETAFTNRCAGGISLMLQTFTMLNKCYSFM